MLSSKSPSARKSILFPLRRHGFPPECDEKRATGERGKRRPGEKEPPAREPGPKDEGAKAVALGRSGTGSSSASDPERCPAEAMGNDKDKTAETGMEPRKPRLGLLTSLLPMLTSRADSPVSPEIHRKPVPGSYAKQSSPTNTASTATETTRTSEDSRSDDASYPHRGTGSATPLSPIEQVSPLSENPAPSESSPRKKLQKVPTMPLSPPPPPPPPAVLTKSDTPPPVPAVTSTQPTPPASRPRDGSPERPPSRARLQPNRLQPHHAPPLPNARGRSVSAQPPAVRGVSVDASRAVSNPVDSRSQSKQPTGDASPPSTAEKKKVRKSWFPGARSRSSSEDMGRAQGPGAWIVTPESRVDYNTLPLVNGDKVPELWNEHGNVLVYLHPKESGRGPSFKVADHVFSSSATLNELLVAEMMAATSQRCLYLDVAPSGPVTEGHLYLPIKSTELECLVAARNLFALLTSQPLVCTKESPTIFAALLQLSALLRKFHFSNYDGSSFGESVDRAFDLFMDQFGLADVRHSREKTLEALIVAEQMRSWNLYNEAFAHAVGKYESLLDLRSPLYNRISVNTRKRLERAHLDLVNRQANVNSRIESFEFPSLFAGVANSTSTEEYRNVRFKEWRSNFGKMRSFVLNYYKGLFGNWPPRARSKKNHFSHNGLNRQCLKILYSDLCALYDLLVDRQSITPRVMDDAEKPSGDSKDSGVDPSISALRQMLTEFEKSSPPVLPPIPYDIPKIPSMTAIYENYNELPAKKQAKYSKSLQPHELQLILIKSRNIDTDALEMPFLLAFKDFELREARGATPQDLADQRIGFWLFLYVVLQSLPMLVVDAPGLHWTEGVEDFLCEAPQGNPPWTEDAGEVRKMWYQTADQNIVELSADVVMFSVEGIYMRSHCWLAAKEWEAASAAGLSAAPPQAHPAPPSDLQGAPLQPPPRSVFRDMDPFGSNNSSSNLSVDTQHQRTASGAGLLSAPNSPHLRPRSGSHADRARHALRASIAIGLEPLPLPAAADRTSRVVSSSGSLSSGSGHGGPGDMYPLSLRTSRSAVNLGSQLGPGGFGFGDGGGGGGGGGYDEFAPRKSSYGGLPSSSLPYQHHGQSDSMGSSNPGGGGSTFDDILKGMDKGKKAKKKLFF